MKGQHVELEVLDWGGPGRLTYLTTSHQSSLPAGMFTVSPGADTARPVICRRIIRRTASTTM